MTNEMMASLLKRIVVGIADGSIVSNTNDYLRMIDEMIKPYQD